VTAPASGVRDTRIASLLEAKSRALASFDLSVTGAEAPAHLSVGHDESEGAPLVGTSGTV